MTGLTALALARGGRASLELNRGRLNDLNVYPVPDGDTGSNLFDTAVALEQGLADPALGSADRPAAARAATRAALTGARGNSGVILSQIVRGLAESLGGEPGAIGQPELARALRSASDAAYRAVRQPVEGTMLTAIREMAEAAEAAGPGTDISELLDAIIAAGEAAVARTPELLQVLRDAGVVDAGAAGLVEFARGLVAATRGEVVLEPTAAGGPQLGVEALHVEASRYRYCTTFLLEGDAVDAGRLEDELDELGDSLLVVGELPVFKVHVHTDDPGAALSAAVAMGNIDRVEIADMRRQTADRERRLSVVSARPATGVVAVAAGAGNEAGHREAGADRVVLGGQSMNPSAGQIAQAVEATDADGVLVLPNNRNVVLAAEHAITLAARPARVVPTRSMATGLAVLEAFDPAASLDANAARLGARNAALRHLELTAAVRDATVDGLAVRQGQHMGLLDGRAIAAGDDAEAVADALVARLAADGATRIVLIRGEDDAFAVEPWLERTAAAHPGVRLELREGGQPLYSLIGWAEGSPVMSAENTAIVLDSTADLAAPAERHRNWRMAPLTVRIDGDVLLDYVEIAPEEFYRRLRSAKEVPQTAAPGPGAWQPVFEELSRYDRILVLPCSSHLSSSMQSAELAARALDPAGTRIRVLDTDAVSGATVLLAEGLQRLLVRGVAEDVLVEWFEQARTRLALLFSVDTLVYLRRGGRIGGTKAAIGGLLRTRPLLTLRDGQVAQYGKVYGRGRVLPAFEQFLCEQVGENEAAHVVVLHAQAPQQAEQLRAMVARLRPQAVIDLVGELGAVVGTHGGPGTLGLGVLTEA